MPSLDPPFPAEADLRSGLQRARLRYPDLDLSRCKLIGWGAGHTFERIYPQLGIELAYTVCIWESNIGQTKCGVPVLAVDTLRNENPKEVLILVFSAMWFDCMRQVAAYGRFRVVRAFQEYPEGHDTATALSSLWSGAPAAVPANAAGASFGLVIQGPVLQGVTRRVLAINRRKFPFARMVLSTWVDTPAEELDLCRPFVDEIVTSRHPPHPGHINAMMQRDSTRAGLAALARHGVTYAFKTRTDQSINGDLALEQLLQAVRTPIAGPDRRQRQRIAFFGPASWRFIPFHLTDQLQFGRVEDLQELWASQDDSLVTSATLDPEAPAHTVAAVAPESMILRCYLRRIGVGHALNLASYWQVLADRFTLMPEASFGFINWKAIALFDITVPSSGDTPQATPDRVSLMTVWTRADWAALQADRQTACAWADSVDRLRLKTSDLTTATPFHLHADGSAQLAER